MHIKALDSRLRGNDESNNTVTPAQAGGQRGFPSKIPFLKNDPFKRCNHHLNADPQKHTIRRHLWR